MRDDTSIDRRRFVSTGAAVLVGAASGLSAACGSEGPSSPPPEPDHVGDIAQNHGHVAVVTAAQAAAGGPLRLEIQGASGHGHVLELSADDVARLRRGERVSLLSTPGWEDKHDHRVTFDG